MTDSLTKFRLLTTAGQIEAQARIDRPLHDAVSQWMSQGVLALIDSRGNPLHVRASAIVAVVEGWG